MIEQALAGVAEREDDRALSKITRMRNIEEGRVGIEVPPWNIPLVEVHRELATVRHRAKDMVCKNKSARKAKQLAKQA